MGLRLRNHEIETVIGALERTVEAGPRTPDGAPDLLVMRCRSLLIRIAVKAKIHADKNSTGGD